MLKKLLIFNFCLLICGLFTNQLAAKKINVITTLPCLADITEEIGGDLVKVQSIKQVIQLSKILL